MKKEPKDHALALVKAGVSAVPIVGGTIASLIGDYIPTATQKSIVKSIDILKARLEMLGNRVDTDNIKKDEFSELFKTCYLIMVRTHQEKKLQGAAELIANILLKEGDSDKLSYTELDHFARCLDALSIGAIQVLGHCVDLAKSRKDTVSDNRNIRFDFTAIHRCVTHIPVDLIMGLLAELNSFHLIHLTGAPSVRTPNYGNYPIEVPPIAFRFATCILGQKN